MSMHTNIGGVWKNSSDQYVNINGVWKGVNSRYVNINGVWRDDNPYPRVDLRKFETDEGFQLGYNGEFNINKLSGGQGYEINIVTSSSTTLLVGIDFPTPTINLTKSSVITVTYSTPQFVNSTYILNHIFELRSLDKSKYYKSPALLPSTTTTTSYQFTDFTAYYEGDYALGYYIRINSKAGKTTNKVIVNSIKVNGYEILDLS